MISTAGYSMTNDSPENLLDKINKNAIRMSLQVLAALVILSSAAEEAPSGASLPFSSCDESFYQNEYYNFTRSIHNLRSVNLTLLIIWEGQTPSIMPRSYFYDFKHRSFPIASMITKDSSNSLFGQVFSRGSQRVYIPLAEDAPGDLSHSYFEWHILNSVNSFRFIVSFHPELSNAEMSYDSKISLIRLFSILNGTFDVNLVLAEDPGHTTIKFYNFTHHSNYLRRILSSCPNCAGYNLRHWIVRKDEVNKNFPVIPYGKVSVKRLGNVWSDRDTADEEEGDHEIEKVTCLFLLTFADAPWEIHDNSQFYFSDWGGIHNLSDKVLHASISNSLTGEPFSVSQMLKAPWESSSQTQNNRYKKIKPERKKKVSTDDYLDGFIVRHIDDVLKLYPNITNQVGDFIPRDDVYYEYKLNGSLQGVFLVDTAKEANKTLTGVHNLEDLNKEPFLISDAVITCLGDVMVVTGANVTLNVKTDDCPFKTLIVKASDTVEVNRNIDMPGKSLLIYSPRIKSVRSHVINLSGKDCLYDRSGGAGGNFTAYIDKYEGSPLKVISHGGKGCSQLRSDPFKLTYSSIFGPNARKFRGESNLTQKNGAKGEDGRIMIYTTGLEHNVFVETANGDEADDQEMTPNCDSEQRHRHRIRKKSICSSASAENDFIANLNEREKIQIFIGHVISDKSLHGSRIIDQAYILSNCVYSSGYGKRERRMYDPSAEPIPENIISAKQWLAMRNNGRRPESSPSAAECYPLTINNYNVECAIDLANRKVSNLSYEVATKLRNFSVSVIDCLQIDLKFVSEFDLVLCNIGKDESPHNSSLFLTQDGLRCYQIRDGWIVCHSKKPNCDFEETTKRAIDFALATLTVRHIQANPLKMIAAPLTDFGSDSDYVDTLSEIFRETYLVLVRDLQLFYQKILKPKAEAVLTEMRRNMSDGRGKSYAQPIMGDTLRWCAVIKNEILRCAPERFDFPKMLAELVLPSADKGPLQHLKNLEEETLSGRMTAFALYLKAIKTELEREVLPAELNKNVSSILDKFLQTIGDFAGQNIGKCERSKLELNLTFITDLMADFREDFIDLEADLPETLLVPFRRTIGKRVSQMNEILDVIWSITSVAEDKEQLEDALPQAFELAKKPNASFKYFDVNFELIGAFENAVSEPDSYLNELYVKILKNLKLERSNLMNLPELSPEICDLKSKLETAFDMELGVWRALQTVRRVEDVRSSIRKTTNSSEELCSNPEAICHMQSVLQDNIATFVFQAVADDFERRIFPFFEDVTPALDRGNLKSSVEKLARLETKYKNYFKHASFDPQNCNNSCQPFYFWSVQDIKSQGQNISNLFHGDPLFLFADPRNGFRGVVKSNHFRIRLVCNSSKLEENVRGTEILLQPAAFSYNSFRNKTYLSTCETPVFKHALGATWLDRLSNNPPSISPYTVWRIQLLKKSPHFDMTEDIVGGIQLVGEGEIVADDTDRPDLVNSSKPEEWEHENIYLTLLQKR